MDAEFWLRRWRENQIGFHQSETTPLLARHWAAVGARAGARVFVPLAGKSLDLLWLAAQGHDVLGVELSPLAVEQFFAEHALQPQIGESRYGRHHRVEIGGGRLELICGDAFALDSAVLADCAAVFDRAALIAWPPHLRRRYVGELYGRLPAGCAGLLITLEFPPHQKEGPPFPVFEDEVRSRYASGWDVDTLERRDILATQPSFIDEGVGALETVVYRLRRRG